MTFVLITGHIVNGSCLVLGDKLRCQEALAVVRLVTDNSLQFCAENTPARMSLWWFGLCTTLNEAVMPAVIYRVYTKEWRGLKS